MDKTGAERFRQDAGAGGENVKSRGGISPVPNGRSPSKREEDTGPDGRAVREETEGQRSGNG